ncbi:MAG: hypothetical protein WCP16_24740 [Pseudanabaena sp. ELA645]|jgi:hypothetical protein
MNATQLANVLQKIKTDPVLQETLRVTKQDWVELNLTTQETFYGINSGVKNANEISDSELENVESNFSEWYICTLTVWRQCTKVPQCQ